MIIRPSLPAFLLLLLPVVLATAAGCGSSADQVAEAKESQDGQAGDAVQGEAASESTAHKQHPANRLAKETSPYLLMHAHNPVDWYPWGEEAFAKAKAENKLIFLSIGYSSCHWCHVMEKESFMDEEIAAYLNEHFVCVKVDREERPDVDEIYMTALQTYNQLTTGRSGGGWPLSMFMTPEGLPLFGGSYFPPRTKPELGLQGFLTVVETIQKFWKEDETALRNQADQLTEYVKVQLSRSEADELNPLSPRVPHDVLESLTFNYDEEHGGFNFSPVNPRVPKFPEPSNLFFLLDVIEQGRTDGATDEAKKSAESAQSMLLATLDHMAAGGIYDQLGGGFHRYSVDRFWRVPHFEKMLYDNGQLASVYAEAYKLTGEPRYRRIVEETLAFVLREMTDEQGGFYSALDADSEGEEGTFYIWKTEDVSKLLADGGATSEDVDLFLEVYGLNETPNFEATHHVLQFSAPLAEIAQSHGLTVDQLWEKLRPLQAKLLEARSQRERPLLDTKILTSWNGLMIRGFADAGRLLDKPEYVEAAQRAADFLLANVKSDDGRLLRTYSAGDAKLNAYLDDYAFLVEGLIALHKATGEQRWLDEAQELTSKQIELFADANHGGFYFTSEDHEALIARSKGTADNVRPGGNSVSASNLLYLADHMSKPEYMDRALALLESNGRTFNIAPQALPRMSIVLRELADRGRINVPLVAPPRSDGQTDGNNAKTDDAKTDDAKNDDTNAGGTNADGRASGDNTSGGQSAGA